LASPEGDRTRRRIARFAVAGDLQGEIAHALGFQRLLDAAHHLAGAGVVTEHVAGIERRPAGLGHLRLAQDAPDQLSHRRRVAAGRQRAQHVGERAIPAFLQGLLGDDGAHRAGWRQQVEVFRLVEFVFFGGLQRDLLFRQAELHQKRLGVLGVNEARVAQILAGALDLNQQDRPDIAGGLGVQGFGLAVQFVELPHGGGQAALPVVPAPHFDVDRQLDHLGVVERAASHIDQDVRAAGLGRCHPGRGRQFQHQAGIEAVEGLERGVGVGMVAFVDDDHRPQQAQGIAERTLDDAAHLPGCRLGVRAERGIDIEIRHLAQQGPVRRNIVLARHEAQHIAAIAEQAQGLLAASRRRLQHQQHHTQVRVGVQTGQRRGLFQNLDPPGGGDVEHLPIRVVAIGQRLHRLPIDRLVRHHPQHQSSVPVQIGRADPRHAGGGQQGLAAAGRQLQAGVGDRPAGTVEAAVVGPLDEGRRQALALAQGVPCLFREVDQLLGHVQLGHPQGVQGPLGLVPLAVQLGQPAAQGIEGVGLKRFQADATQRLDIDRMPARLPEQLAVAFDAGAEIGVANLLEVDNIHVVQQLQVVDTARQPQKPAVVHVRSVDCEIDVGLVTLRGARPRPEDPDPLDVREVVEDGAQQPRRALRQTERFTRRHARSVSSQCRKQGTANCLT